MVYTVLVGLSQEISITADCIGDAFDFAMTCVENGYRVTIIPVDEDESNIRNVDDLINDIDGWEKEEAKALGLGDRIKKCLEGNGMSQRELAAKCKCTEVTMSRYISGDRTPKGPMIVLIAKALGVSCDWLLGID